MSPNLGRRKTGALSSYPLELRKKIKIIRSDNEGWGAISILVELADSYNYHSKELPSADAVNRFLKEEGFIGKKIPKSKLPKGQQPNKIDNPHDLWELDAQGAEYVKGLGYVSMINIKDSKTKTYIMSFPVQVKGRKSQPKTVHYLWSLRLAFEEFCLPKAIQVDKDSVFIDNTSKSPFPSRFQLFLTSLGIELCFIDAPPPAKQAMVERSHQTMYKQVLQGKKYDNWHELFVNNNKRRKVMNEKYPSRSLNKQAPLQVYPETKNVIRPYQIGQEKQASNLKRIERFLAQCVWFRKVSKAKTLSLNAKVYYLKKSNPETFLSIRFCAEDKKIIFRDANELVIQELLVKDFAINLLEQLSIKELLAMKKKIFKNKDFPLQ